MEILDVTDFKLREFYHRAWHESHGGQVDPRKYRYLDSALSVYAKAHGCTYDEALIFAKSGKKVGRLAE